MAVNRWTHQELELLREHYGKMPPAELQAKYFPERTVGAVMRKASDLGLAGWLQWTPEEDEILRKHYKEKTAREIQKMLPHRSLDAIRQRRAIKGFYKQAPRKVEKNSREATLLKKHALEQLDEARKKARKKARKQRFEQSPCSRCVWGSWGRRLEGCPPHCLLFPACIKEQEGQT